MRETAATALVCDIQRFSVHDGPGIRTNIYFKGCPLHCQWCHNPETLSFKNELIFRAKLCIHCGDCVSACPQKAISLVGKQLIINRDRCDDCMRCTAVCPSESLEPAARSYDAATLLNEVLKEREFYGSSGGLTISGGEPLMQIALLKDLLPGAKAAGMHVTVETAGFWAYESVRELLDQIDLILFDIKMIDEQKHRYFVGQSNQRILENFRLCVADGRHVVARMPVIPGINDDTDNIGAVAGLLHAVNMNEIVLLPYHTGGQPKLEYLGERSNRLAALDPLNMEQLAKVRNLFAAQGIRAVAS